MRKIFLATVLLLAASGTAQAKTIVAICNDGQNVQLNVTIGGGGILYLKTATGTVQIASLEHGYESPPIAYCVAEKGMGGPLAGIQLCATTQRIEVLTGHTAASQTGNRVAFCNANIAVH